MSDYAFGQRLRELRRERDLSLAEVATRTGTTTSTLSKYERDVIDPTLEVAKRLAEFFMVSVDWLSGTGELEDAFASVPQPYIEVIRFAMKKNVTPEKLKKAIELFVE